VGVLSSGASSGSSMFGMPTMGMKTFSLSAEEKLSFFAGESDILRDSMAEAACWTVSYKRVLAQRIFAVVGNGRGDGTFLEGVTWIDMVEI